MKASDVRCPRTVEERADYWPRVEVMNPTESRSAPGARRRAFQALGPSAATGVTGRLARACAVAAAVLLWGCAQVPGVPPEPPQPRPDQVKALQAQGPAWRGVPFPGKRSTHYRPLQHDGRTALHARADTSASMWRRPVKVDAHDLGRVRFSWNVPRLIEHADLSDRDAEDTPVRIVLAFEGDHARLSLRNRMMFDLAETLTGERPPYATLMYVWDTRAAVGSVIPAARTDRVRKLVVESGAQRLQRWLSYERDVVADYRHMFGEDPGPLVGVAFMTDSDNTESQTEAYYGDIELYGKAGQPLL